MRYRLLIWWMTNSVYRKLESEIMWWTMVNEHWFFQSTMVLTMIYLMRVTDKDTLMDGERMNLQKNPLTKKMAMSDERQERRQEKKRFLSLFSRFDKNGTSQQTISFGNNSLRNCILESNSQNSRLKKFRECICLKHCAIKNEIRNFRMQKNNASFSYVFLCRCFSC